MTRKRKRKRTSKTRRPEYPGWLWMLFGLSIGLSVALAIYMNDRESVDAMRAAPQSPVRAAGVMEDKEIVAAAQPDVAPERRFDFYHMLPNFEVIIPEHEADVSPDMEQRPLEQPGNYVLQAGSFTVFADADRRRAQLALQGIESRIQRVSIDDKTYHRVRIGPTRDLDKLNTMRARLREAKIDVLRIRLGD